MNRLVKRAAQVFGAFSGWDPRLLLSSLKQIPAFVESAVAYRNSALGTPSAMPLSISNLFPILSDATAHAGVARGHYFFQDLWMAQRVYENHPSSHVDVGSRVDGFIAHLLTTMKVTVVDVRPLVSEVPGLTFIQDDGSSLRQFEDGSLESLSSLHAVEHFGLGRYGDPVDAGAHERAMRSFVRVLRPGGHLYFSVPVGRERVEFNAHRIFAPTTVLDVFSDLKLERFAAVGDDGSMMPEARPGDLTRAEYGCGLFVFSK